MVPRVVLSAVALAGVLVSVVMVVVGLPEATAAQTVLLELSSLPLSVSVAAGVWLLHLSAARPAGRRSRMVLSGAAATIAFGLVLMAWAYLAGPRDRVHTGQVLVWLGLFTALVVMIRRQPRRRSTRFALLADDEDDAGGDGEDDAPADRDRTPSL